MPIFGQPAGMFSWPTTWNFQSWDHNQGIFLTAIHLKTGDALRGIKFNLSNGTESPLYETDVGETQPLQSFDIDSKEEIGLITTCASPDNKHLWGIKFSSNKGETIFEVNWFDYNLHSEKNFKVKNGDKVVGFYGDIDESTITAFGLILYYYPDAEDGDPFITTSPTDTTEGFR